MKWKYALVANLLLLFACSVPPSNSNIIPRFLPAEQSLFDIPKGQEFTFGYLEVPENRTKSNSRTIQLPVYIFKSRSADPKPDPVIYTVGGPGQTSMRAASYMKYYRYLDDRDFILFEQRGTTYARPHLDCPEWAEAVYQANLPGVNTETADRLFQNAAENCKERLQGKGIDLNAYHTNAIAADIEDLRKVLGIEQYNLLTISYSTKIAQVLMRDYPQAIRSVVMDSPLPLEVNYDEESTDNLLAAYEQLFADCAKAPQCKQAFPNLKDRFYQFLKEKTTDPLVMKVNDPNKDEPLNFHLQGKDLIQLLGTSYTGDIPEIPWRIENILSGDLGFIEKQLQALLEGPGDGSGQGMRLSVWCAEETPFASREKIREKTDKYPAIKGLSPAVFKPEICDIWGVHPVDEQENEALISSIPTLLISGEYDHETPPKWAARMQANLKNSFHIVFKGWHHTPTTYWNNPCGMAVANTFFNQPDQAPQPDCLKDIKRPTFKTK